MCFIGVGTVVSDQGGVQCSGETPPAPDQDTGKICNVDSSEILMVSSVKDL